MTFVRLAVYVIGNLVVMSLHRSLQVIFRKKNSTDRCDVQKCDLSPVSQKLKVIGTYNRNAMRQVVTNNVRLATNDGSN